jgi:hypothetical protein
MEVRVIVALRFHYAFGRAQIKNKRSNCVYKVLTRIRGSGTHILLMGNQNITGSLERVLAEFHKVTLSL